MGIIRNFETLATTEARRDALAIAEAGYAAIDVAKAFERKVKVEGDEIIIDGTRRSLRDRRVFFVGVGKCAFVAGIAVEKLLGERLTASIAIDVQPKENYQFEKTEAYTGTHPEPSENNAVTTKRIIDVLSDCRESDLVIMLISGGGSTLLACPESPMGPSDERMLFNALTKKGADIRELNTVRKHLSHARGGGLAQAAYPAEIVSLIISDVPGNPIGFIASGPTVHDDSTIADAQAILTRHDVTPTADTVFIETPKEEKYFERVENILFLTNKDALDAMRVTGTNLGYETRVVNDSVTGEARELARKIAEELHAAPAKTVLLYGGESTVALGQASSEPNSAPATGATLGKGGRNQELALAALSEVRDGELILPFASDGHDDTDHAGAIVDAPAHELAQEQLITDALARHDSYTFFARTGDFIETGYLESNVSDLVVAIKT
jgi:glycerate 2-kinase